MLGLTEERLSDEEISFLEKDCKPYLDFLDKTLTVIDTAATPNTMFASLVDTINEEDDYKFVIVDTVNAISADSGESKMDSIKKWNQEYALKIFRNEKNCTMFHLQQLDKSSTARQFNNKGESVYEKYVPTVEALGNDKEAVNSASLALALFDPSLYRIPEIEGWYPREWNGGLRLVYVLKNNFGDINVFVPFYYDGEINEWTEIMEAPEEFVKNKNLYQKYIKTSNLGKKMSDIY